MINPKSIAGVLLREHDNIEQAAGYAGRKARLLVEMGNGIGLDYAEAEWQLRAEIADRIRAENPIFSPSSPPGSDLGERGPQEVDVEAAFDAISRALT